MRQLSMVLSACAAALLGWALAGSSMARAEPPLIPHSGTGHRVSPYYPYGTFYYDPNRFFYAPRVVYTTPKERYPKYYAVPEHESRSASVIYPENRTYGRRAKIRVHVPEGAEVFVQGTRMPPAGGTMRVFLTDPLEPGRNHYYVVRARWRFGSLDYGQSEIVDIRAGESIDVDFLGRVPKDPTFVPNP